MARRYLIFGSDDKVNWELLNTLEASGASQALSKAREQEAHRHYACTPERNWTAATPEVVERKPIVKWAPVTSGQLTVDDALREEPEPPYEPEVEPEAETKVQQKVAEAREALSE